MHESGVNRPFRFIYMSGISAERDQTKTPSYMPQYSLMRVSTLDCLKHGLCINEATGDL